MRAEQLAGRLRCFLRDLEILKHDWNLTDSAGLPRNFSGKKIGRRIASPPGLKFTFGRTATAPPFCGDQP
jgi:hypothetical protein